MKLEKKLLDDDKCLLFDDVRDSMKLFDKFCPAANKTEDVHVHTNLRNSNVIVSADMNVIKVGW